MHDRIFTLIAALFIAGMGPGRAELRFHLCNTSLNGVFSVGSNVSAKKGHRVTKFDSMTMPLGKAQKGRKAKVQKCRSVELQMGAKECSAKEWTIDTSRRANPKERTCERAEAWKGRVASWTRWRRAECVRADLIAGLKQLQDPAP